MRPFCNGSFKFTSKHFRCTKKVKIIIYCSFSIGKAKRHDHLMEMFLHLPGFNCNINKQQHKFD